MTTTTMMMKRYPVYKDSGIEWLGEIPEYWEMKRLKYTFHVVNGSTPRSSEPAYWDGDIVWVTPEDLGNLRSEVIFAAARMITKEGYSSCGTTLVPKDSLVLSTRAPIGHLARAGVPLCTNQGCRSLVFHKDSNHPFFFYQILAAKQELQSWGQGSTFMELSKERLESITIITPPLVEQQAIANYLDRQTAKIDALIAKKERQIELLKEKRIALISHAVTKGLNPAATMKDSGTEWLGEIPEHWEIFQIRRAIDRFVDYRGKTPEKTQNGVCLVTAGNIKNGFIDYSLCEDFIRQEDYEDWMVRGLPEIGDVLITTEAPLGESAQVDNPNIALAQRIILLKANKHRISNEYLKCYIRSKSGIAELWSRATGSTAVGIKAWHLKEILIIVPPLAEQQAIADYLDHETAKIDVLIAKIQLSIDKLKEYRTALIPAAVTGKIDLRGEA